MALEVVAPIQCDHVQNVKNSVSEAVGLKILSSHTLGRLSRLLSSQRSSRSASPTSNESDESCSINTSSSTSVSTSPPINEDTEALCPPNALVKAKTKANLSILEKRMRIGKTKRGHTRCKYIDRSFKPPEGNVINLQHEQYALTYGMMCGIRDSAGLQKPFKQRLTMDDFMSIDIKTFPQNSQLQHPFKFKDYSPDVFRQVRRRFGIDLADYMLTLSGDFNFIEFMSNSKSGQFFFYSHDGRFMIKTQTKDESKFLRRILPHYFKFVMENPNTMITRFYGMHRVKMHHLRRKMHFVIMASVFDTPLDIHARFDLKGSRVGRQASPKELMRGSSGVLKDNDLLAKGFHLQMGVARRTFFLVQLRRDVEFLKRMKIMDYSLLIGVHDAGCEPQSNLYSRSKSSGIVVSHQGDYATSDPTSPTRSKLGLSMEVTRWRPFRSSSAPDNAIALQRPLSGASASIQTHLTLSPPSLPSYGSSSLGLDRGSETSSDGGNGISFENAVDDFSSPANRSSSGSSLTPRSFGSPTEPLSPRLLDTAAYGECPESVFCKDEGGIYGRDRHGRKNGFVYFLGIIDILQQYNTRKIAETFLKGLRHNRRQISSVNPDFYGDRFIEFVEKHVVQDDTLISSRPLLSPTYATSIVGTSPFKQKNSC